MEATLKFSTPSSSAPATRTEAILDWLPFHLQFDGEIPAIRQFFHVAAASTSNTAVNQENSFYKSSFRGRALHGVSHPVPQGFKGMVISTNGDSFGRSRQNHPDLNSANGNNSLKRSASAMNNGSSDSQAQAQSNGNSNSNSNDSDINYSEISNNSITVNTASSKPTVNTMFVRSTVQVAKYSLDDDSSSGGEDDDTDNQDEAKIESSSDAPTTLQSEQQSLQQQTEHSSNEDRGEDVPVSSHIPENETKATAYTSAAPQEFLADMSHLNHSQATEIETQQTQKTLCELNHISQLDDLDLVGEEEALKIRNINIDSCFTEIIYWHADQLPAVPTQHSMQAVQDWCNLANLVSSFFGALARVAVWQ